MIASGKKTIEVRSWQTAYRGDILLTASNVNEDGCIPGHAILIACLDDITVLKRKDLKKACMDSLPKEKNYAWHLSNIRLVKPVPVKGKLHLWECNTRVKVIGGSEK